MPSLAPVFVYCKRSKTGAGEGLGTRVVVSSGCSSGGRTRLTFMNKLPGVITTYLNDFCLNRQAFLALTEKDPAFQIKVKGWVQSWKRIKQLLSYIIQNQLAMTRGILFHKGQPCPTSSLFVQCVLLKTSILHT